MSILSQLLVNKTDAARGRLSDAYAWHQTIWKSFPDRDGERRRFLFRVDDVGRHFRLLLLSEFPPEGIALGQWHSKTVAPSFLTHRFYRFQIKANPTMRRASDRRRIGIYSEEKLNQWIENKARQNGFEIETNTLIIGAPLDEVFVRNRVRGKHVSVDFQGVLQVTENEKIKFAFENGIGSAKSFGYGMLMLQPI